MKPLYCMTTALVLGVVTAGSCAIRVTAQPAPATDTARPASTCLSGYPDGTYRGDQPITRSEFAAGLSACLDSLRQRLDQTNFAKREDFEATLQRQQELNEQLRELSDRVESASPTQPAQ